MKTLIVIMLGVLSMSSCASNAGRYHYAPEEPHYENLETEVYPMMYKKAEENCNETPKEVSENGCLMCVQREFTRIKRLAFTYKAALDYEAKTGRFGAKVALPPRYSRLSDTEELKAATKRITNDDLGYTSAYILSLTFTMAADGVELNQSQRELLGQMNRH